MGKRGKAVSATEDKINALERKARLIEKLRRIDNQLRTEIVYGGSNFQQFRNKCKTHKIRLTKVQQEVFRNSRDMRKKLAMKLMRELKELMEEVG